MANKLDNLMPIEEVNARKTPEERKEAGRRAGIASGNAKRKRKTMREQLEILMKLNLTKKDVIKHLKELGIDNDEINNQMAMQVVMLQEALKGNTKAYELIRDTLGEKPIEHIQNLNPPVINIERPKE